MREYSNSFFKDKQIYQSRDVRTSNPRKLFRYLSDVLDKLGYETDYDTDSVQIKRDEVGESGYVNAIIIADKDIEVEEEGRGSHYLDIKQASKLQGYTLVASSLVTIAGLVMMFTGMLAVGAGLFLAGVVISIGVYMTMLKRRSAIILYPVSIWIAGAGEIYRARLTESRGLDLREQGVSQDQVVSELTIRIAAESDPPIRLEELERDLRYLLASLDSAD